MEDERERQKSTLVNLADYEKGHRKPAAVVSEEDKDRFQNPTVARIEDHAVRALYALLERPAGNRRFWIVTTVGMFLVTAGPAAVIYLYFLGRDLGYF